MVPVFVHPIPTQQHVLAALDTLGFMIRQSGLLEGGLPGVEHTLPLHQRWGYWVGPLYAGPITELEVIFVTNSAGLEAILWMDRRLALAGITHQSISRFRIWHEDADRRDWVATVDGWIRQAINRHAAAAAHADWSAQIAGSAHVSRHPDEPIRPGYGLGGTAGGAGVGGGGRRRRRHLTVPPRPRPHPRPLTPAILQFLRRQTGSECAFRPPKCKIAAEGAVSRRWRWPA